MFYRKSHVLLIEKLKNEVKELKDLIYDLNNDKAKLQGALNVIANEKSTNIWLRDQGQMLLSISKEARKSGVTRIKYDYTEIEFK